MTIKMYVYDACVFVCVMSLCVFGAHGCRLDASIRVCLHFPLCLEMGFFVVYHWVHQASWPSDSGDSDSNSHLAR